MYEAFFGLNEPPFQLTPNPRFLFLTAAHREALATLRYGLTSSLGITLLLGEAGTGKTTLLTAALLAERRPKDRIAVLSNPTLSPADFYEILADRFELPEGSATKGRFLLAFERDLLERHRAGGGTAIVIDEAQSLTHALFEEIRLLANLETATAKLVNVVLVGQPELADRLNDPSLRQLKQRIILRAELAPLSLKGTASYIAARLRVAGATPTEVFTKDAVGAIHEASHGIPRTIGVLCENALLAGYAAQSKPVDKPMVIDVCRDLDLPVNGRPPRAEGAPKQHGLPRRRNTCRLPSQDAARLSPRYGSRPGARTVGPTPSTRPHPRIPRPPSARGCSSSSEDIAHAYFTGHGPRAHVPRTGRCAGPDSPLPQTSARAGSGAQSRAAQATKPVVPGPVVPVEPGFTIGPEDVLGILVWREPDVSGDVTVRPDGMVTLPLIREVKAAGLTPNELADRIQTSIREFITDAAVTVVVRQMNSRKVFITGEVARPGAYPLLSSMTVMQLIAVAGGLNEYAESKSISVMRFEAGKTKTFPFDYKNVASGKKTEQNIVLKPGDTVVVPER